MSELGNCSSSLDEQELCLPKSIQIIGDQETRQSFSNLNFPSNPILLAQGWERRFITDPDRLDEVVGLYTELGFEVHVEDITPSELSEACGGCGLAICIAHKTIYTRKAHS